MNEVNARLRTMNATIWAEEFCRSQAGLFVNESRSAQEIMLGWFANAIETARDLSHNSSYRTVPREKTPFRTKLFDFAATVGIIGGYSIFVGATICLIGHIVIEIRETDRKNVRLLYDWVSKTIVPALVMGESVPAFMTDAGPLPDMRVEVEKRPTA